jgi:hypothetical protein
MYVLLNGMTLAQEIVANPIFLIAEILTIEDNELHDTFLHVAYGSQSWLRIMSDLTRSDTNWRNWLEGGEQEPNKISFARNQPMSHVQNPKQKPLKESEEEHKPIE